MIQKAPPQQIPLGGGLRTDIDPKILPLGNVLELENAIQRLTGAIVKRFGGNALPNNVNSLVVSSLALPAWQLANHKADLIRLQTQGPSPISRWSPTANAWAYCGFGDFTNLEPTIQSVLRGPFATATNQVSSIGGGAVTCDHVSGSGYDFRVFRNAIGSQSTFVLQVNDQASGAMVWRYSVTAGAGKVARVTIANGYAVMAWVDTSSNTVGAVTVLISTLGSTTPTVATAAVGTTTHASAPWFDIIPFGTLVVMAWRTSTNKTFASQFTPSLGTHVQFEVVNASSVSINSADTLAFVQNQIGYANVGLISCDHAGVGLQVNAGWANLGGFSTQTHILDATPGTTVQSATGVFTTAAASADVNVVYSLSNVPGLAFQTASDLIRFAECTAGVIFQGLWIRSVRAVTKMFQINGDNFIVAGYAGAVAAFNGLTGSVPVAQRTYVLLRVPHNMFSTPESSALITAPLARIMPGDANVGPTPFLIGVSVTGSVAITAADRIVRETSEAASVDIETQGWALTITANPRLGTAVEAGDCLYVPGAQLNVFDGQNYADDAFAVFPEQAALAPTAGGFMNATGIYNYCWVYRYTDAQGRVNRSAPSIPTTANMTAGTGSVVITAKALNLTQRELLNGTTVSLETYRTDDINTGAPPLNFQLLRVDPNDPTQDSLVFTDTVASIATGQPLYTTGGVLQNDVTPGFSSLGTFDGRIWGVSMDFPDTLWYSEQIADGGASPHWSNSRTMVIQDEHGGITAIKALDDKLVVFKKDAVYVVTGTGPDPTGQNDLYQPSLVALGVGTTNPQSIAVVGFGSPGVVFQSTSQRAGYFLLDRGVSLQYIGDKVQQYMEAATAAILVPGQSQMRFYTASGRTLVYDFVGQIWSTFTGQPALHATCWNDTVSSYARATTNDVVTEDPTGATYLEAGVFYGMHAATPWLKLAELNGFERFFRIQGVGVTAGPHILRVRLYKDFDNTAPFTDQFCAPGPLWDWETRYSAKLSALKVVLDDLLPMGLTQSAGPQMTALALILGVKAGLKKLPSVNRTT